MTSRISGSPRSGTTRPDWGEGTKTLDGCHDPANRKLRVAPRIQSDVVTNRLHVPDRLRGPLDCRHWLRCRLTSSCGTPLPSSSSPSPASILAIKINRSIASSNVASAGRFCSPIHAHTPIHLLVPVHRRRDTTDTSGWGSKQTSRSQGQNQHPP